MSRRDDRERDFVVAECPHCGERTDVPRSREGSKFRCPECDEAFFIEERQRGRERRETKERVGGSGRSRGARKGAGKEKEVSAGGILAVIAVSGIVVVVFFVGIFIMMRAAARNRGAEPEPPAVVAWMAPDVGAPVEFVVPPVRVEPPTLEKVLDDLRKTDVFTQSAAAKALLAMKVEEGRRGEVIRVLTEVIDKRQPFSPRAQMVEVLGLWATKAEVPYFIKLMDDHEGGVKEKAIFALGKLKDGRAADPLALRLGSHSDRRHASEALKDIGPAAETVVANCLNNPDVNVCIEACRILKVIGSKESYPALAKLAYHEHGDVALAAREAIPPEERPPIYDHAQIMRLYIQVPNMAVWPAIEGKLLALAESKKHVMFKITSAGETMIVTLAPVTADPTSFAKRIDFGRITDVQVSSRIVYVSVK